ncbi:MAG TPA: hypothetical protein PLA23_00995 [Methanospirillum sp.]|nr:hypothetical protein [Methanospirillum sp.]
MIKIRYKTSPNGWPASAWIRTGGSLLILTIQFRTHVWMNLCASNDRNTGNQKNM